MAEPAVSESPLPEIGSLATTAEVISLAEVVARRADKFQKLVADLEAGIAARGEATRASLEAAGIPADQWAGAVAKQVSKARVEVTTNSDAARWAALREMTAASDSLGMTALLYASPVTVLARAGLGEAKRTDYIKQMAGAGPTELRSYAAFALATKNKVLGAALMSVVDRMPRRDRPFSVQELAEKLVGEDQRSVATAIAAIRRAVQTSLNLNRELTAGKRNPVERVRLTLNKETT